MFVGDSLLFIRAGLVKHFNEWLCIPPVVARSVATKQSSKFKACELPGLLRCARNDSGLHIYSYLLLNAENVCRIALKI